MPCEEIWKSSFSEQLRNSKSSFAVFSTRRCGGRNKSRCRACSDLWLRPSHTISSPVNSHTEASHLARVLFWRSTLHVGETGAIAGECQPGERVSRPLTLSLIYFPLRLHWDVFLVGPGFQHPGMFSWHQVQSLLYKVRVSEITIKQIKHKDNIWFGVALFYYRLPKTQHLIETPYFFLSADFISVCSIDL